MHKQILSILLLTVSCIFLTNSVHAQKSKIGSAQILLDEGKALEAKTEIDAALQDEEIQKMPKAWNTKGEVYRNIYETKIYYLQNPNCLFIAKDAYTKAIELELNPKKQKDFIASLTAISGYLFNEGLERFNIKKNEDAYKHFDASRVINNYLFDKKFIPALDTNAIYATAIAGANINKYDEALPLLEKLVDMNYNNVAAYEVLAQIYDNKKEKEKLVKFISLALSRFPKNNNLMMYDLNSTLEGGNDQSKLEKLLAALENDPKNTSILFNIGAVYDKMKNTESAKEYYLKAISMKADYGDAYYNLGVMYFNAGVEVNKKMNAIEEKDDRDGKKYTAMKAERDELFKLALPNLEKAFEIDPKNQDYRQNLKKVYASMNMLEKAKALSE